MTQTASRESELLDHEGKEPRTNTSSRLQNCTNVLQIRPTWRSVEVGAVFRTMTKFNQKRLWESTVNTSAGARREDTAASELLVFPQELFSWGCAEIKLILGWGPECALLGFPGSGPCLLVPCSPPQFPHLYVLATRQIALQIFLGWQHSTPSPCMPVSGRVWQALCGTPRLLCPPLSRDRPIPLWKHLFPSWLSSLDHVQPEPRLWTGTATLFL